MTKPKTQRPRWVAGKPDDPGLWFVVLTNRDHAAVSVVWDQDDDGPRYLRVYDDGGSEPLADYRWAARSFGPIPESEVQP